jgi:hypothetical protein
MKKRLFYLLGNVCGGIVLVLLILDPTRPLLPIFALLGLAVGCVVLAGLTRRTPEP